MLKILAKAFNLTEDELNEPNSTAELMKLTIEMTEDSIREMKITIVKNIRDFFKRERLE